jgi:hypothetical protein
MSLRYYVLCSVPDGLLVSYSNFPYCAIYRYRKDFGILRREGFYAPPASPVITVHVRVFLVHIGVFLVLFEKQAAISNFSFIPY